jgi:hypothetical protein
MVLLDTLGDSSVVVAVKEEPQIPLVLNLRIPTAS